MQKSNERSLQKIKELLEILAKKERNIIAKLENVTFEELCETIISSN